MSDKEHAKKVQECTQALNDAVREAYRSGLVVDMKIHNVGPTRLSTVKCSVAKPIRVRAEA